MGATLGELQIEQNYSLGTSETQLYTVPSRYNAINRALKDILMMYDLVEYITYTNVSFTSGRGAIPDDCLRPNLLVNTQNNQEYQLVDFETFNQHNQFTYTVKYDATTKTRYMHTWPHNNQTLEFVYVQTPEILLVSTDEIRLSYHWNQAIAEKSAAILLRQTRNYDVAQDKDASAKKMIDDAYQNDRPILQGRALNRLQSIYERNNMFPNSYFSNFSMSGVPSTNMTWQTITADVDALPNYGYFTQGLGTRGITLPANGDINEGDVIGVGYSTAPWIIMQNAGQYIIFGDITTTVGIGGSLQSTSTGDAMTIIYQGNGVFQVLPGAIGNIIYV